MPITTYGQRLRQARKAAGLTQRQLAKLVGQAATTIANLEQGGTRASTKTAAIARALGIRPEWLEEGTGQMLFDLNAPRMQIQRPAAATPTNGQNHFAFTRDDLDLAAQIARLPAEQRQALVAMLLAFEHSNDQAPTPIRSTEKAR